jgi:CheY-like chemotaxis protein
MTDSIIIIGIIISGLLIFSVLKIKSISKKVHQEIKSKADLLSSQEVRKKILIAEDDVVLIDLMKKNIDQLYEIISARNEFEGLRMVQEHLPDLIIMDIKMPNIDGLNLLGRIRKDINTSDTPVIIISADMNTKYFTTEFKKGTIDYITKPFSAEELYSKIKSVLEKNTLKAKSH